MKYLKFILCNTIVLLIMALLVLTACQSAPNIVCGVTPHPSNEPVTLEYNDKNIVMLVGDKLTVKLAGNPTTGFDWLLQEQAFSSIDIIPVGWQQAESTDAVGAGGHTLWEIRAIAKGKSTITWDYVQPWQADNNAQRFSIKLETYECPAVN